MPTVNLPRQNRSGVEQYGPYDLTAGPHNANIAPTIASPGDWTTGAPGRTVEILAQYSRDGGATWDAGSGATLTTPQLGKDGVSAPSVSITTAADEPEQQVRFVVTYSATINCGWTVTYN